MISPPVDLIFFCYKVYQEKFKTLKVVQFFEGFDSSTVTKQQLKGKTVLLILDNLMMTIKPEKLFSHWYYLIPSGAQATLRDVIGASGLGRVKSIIHDQFTILVSIRS